MALLEDIVKVVHQDGMYLVVMGDRFVFKAYEKEEAINEANHWAKFLATIYATGYHDSEYRRN